jgi:plastocyanin domain-containing protein
LASMVVLLHLRTCSWILDLNTATSIPGIEVIHLPWWWMISASPGSGWSSANWAR